MDQQPTRTNVLAMAVIFEGGMGLLALALGWMFDCPPADEIHWTRQGWTIGLLASLPLALCLVVLVRFPFGPLRPLKEVVEQVIVPIFAQCTWFDLAFISVFAGLGEELLFRGVIQNGLAHWHSPTLGLIVASVLFGLVHPITTSYAVLAGLFGLYLGAIWLWTDNLLVPIVAHAAYDFLALMYFKSRGSGIGNRESE